MRHVSRRDTKANLFITEVTADELAAMDEYSCSLPTGPSIGRVWRRISDSEDFMGHVYAHEGGYALIEWRKLEVVEGKGDPRVLSSLRSGYLPSRLVNPNTTTKPHSPG